MKLIRLSVRTFGLSCTAALLGGFGGVISSANAEIIQQVQIENTFGTLLGGGIVPNPQDGGSSEKIVQSAHSGAIGSAAELGLQYDATADSSGFYFLHNNYCVGACSTISQTTITFDLLNTGANAVNLRFDSMITPGHLSRIVGDPRATGGFNFNVDQIDEDVVTSLYSASATVDNTQIALDTGNLPFQGLKRTVGLDDSEDPQLAWEAVNWSATNLNLNLATLQPGASTRVVYTASYDTNAIASCDSVDFCPGLQVVFGDPRNNGGVTNFARSAFANSLTPVIGGQYTPYRIPFSFVPSDTPLPDQPPLSKPITYGPLFQSQFIASVPEPGSWALLILGFGMIGAATRSRRRQPTYA